MPLLDHFHPPITEEVPWESFHANWAVRLADTLNEQWLPPEYLAVELTHAGTQVEIDVATLRRDRTRSPDRTNGPATATLPARVWTPTEAPRTMPAVFPESFGVRIFSQTGGLTLVAAIELVSPGNKDRADERRAFATKCASYLYSGVSLVVMDIVTSRRANLHNEILTLMDAADEYRLPAEMSLYAAAYRPVKRPERPEIDLWTTEVGLGAPLPTLPLGLPGDLFVPVEFEPAYQEACRRRRLA